MFDIFEEYCKTELKSLNYNFAFLEILVKDLDYTYDRGARVNRVWNYVASDQSKQKVIEEVYEYEFAYEPDLKNRRVTKVTKKVRFYKGDGSIGMERTIKQRDDEFFLEQLNRQIRHNRLDYLKSEIRVIEKQIPFMAEEPTNIKAHYQNVVNSINFIIAHYSVLQLKYIEDGKMDLENAVKNEADPEISAHLDIVTIFPGQEEKWPNGQTLRQAIIHQLNGDIS